MFKCLKYSNDMRILMNGGNLENLKISLMKYEQF